MTEQESKQRKMKNGRRSAGMLHTLNGWLDGGARQRWGRGRCMLYAVLLTLGYTAAVSAVFSWVYILNDDRFMKEVLSGVYNGIPDAHVIFIKYPLALVIRNLYRRLPGRDWYGLVLLTVSLVSLCLILFRVLRVRETWKGKAFLTGAALLLYTAAWLPRLLAFTYTTVAAMAGATALFWYATGGETQDRLSACLDAAVTAALALLSYAIRDSVFFMLLPFAAILFWNRLAEQTGHGTDTGLLAAGERHERKRTGWKRTGWKWIEGKQIERKQIEWKQVRRNLVRAMILPLILGGMVLCVWQADRQAYAGSGWERILRDRDARSVIYNYCGPAPYEEHRDFYDSIGIHEDTWQALVRYNLVVDEDLDTEHLYQIAAYSQRIYEASSGFLEKWKTGLTLAWDGAMKSGCQPLNWLAILLSVWVLCYGLAKKDRRLLRTTALLAVMALVLWVALGMGGRLPRRVAESLHLCVLLSMAGVYLKGGMTSGCDQTDPADTTEADAPETKGLSAAEDRSGRSVGSGRPAQSTWNGMPRGLRQKILCCFALPLLLLFLVDAYKWIGHTTRQTRAGAENYQIVLDYCMAHPDLFYLADVYSVVGYADVFTLRDDTRELNILPFGDWLAFSPMYEARLEQQGITDLTRDILTREDIRILCRDYYDMEYLLSYYVRHGADVELVVVDTIRQNGEAMDVYQFRFGT